MPKWGKSSFLEENVRNEPSFTPLQGQGNMISGSDIVKRPNSSPVPLKPAMAGYQKAQSS